MKEFTLWLTVNAGESLATTKIKLEAETVEILEPQRIGWDIIFPVKIDGKTFLFDDPVDVET